MCAPFPQKYKVSFGVPGFALSLSHCDKSLFCDVLSDIFLFRENCIKKCHSFPSHLSLYFIKYASSILFLKILKYYNSTILYKSPKNPIFVQLSPIQCTYSNIFIRFFKFFPANTNIYQNSYSLQCGHLISFGTKCLMSLREVAYYGNRFKND